MEINVENIKEQLLEMVILYGPRLITALLTLIIGLWVIRMIGRGISRVVDKRNIDVTLKPFLVNISTMILKVMLIVSVLGMVGIEMTSFIAILGAAGLAIGLALSGTLQNFASGVMLLIFKPFNVGDFIEVSGYSGVVNKILIFNTILKTPDNKTIFLPNNAVSGNSLVNYSTEDNRRVDFAFGIGYQDDIDKAKAIINRLIAADDRIMKDPESFVAVSELADSSVNLVVRIKTKKEDYWGIFFDLQEIVKKTFDAEGVSIPFPQRDIHVFNN